MTLNCTLIPQLVESDLCRSDLETVNPLPLHVCSTMAISVGEQPVGVHVCECVQQTRNQQAVAHESFLNQESFLSFWFGLKTSCQVI